MGLVEWTGASGNCKQTLELLCLMRAQTTSKPSFSHITSVCAIVHVFGCTWSESERKQEKETCVRVCLHVCICDCRAQKAFQRHYSIRFMRAFTETLAIKQRSQLLSKVHIRSYCGERVLEGECVRDDGG